MIKLNTDSIAAVFKKPGEKQQEKLIANLSKSPTGFSLIEKMIQNESRPDVLRWVATALREFRSPKAKRYLKGFLRHEAMSVRLHAMRAVSDFPGLDITKEIGKLVRDESGGIRINALVILQRRGYKRINLVCKAMAKDPKWYIRKKAEEILKKK